MAFFPSLKHNFIAYHSSKLSSRPDCIFEIPQLWQSGFSRVYSNCCCSCLFEHGIIKIGQSSHNILDFQESPTILNACTKKSGSLLNAPRISFSRVLALCEMQKTLSRIWTWVALAIYNDDNHVGLFAKEEATKL